jgi:hypothetical protein
MSEMPATAVAQTQGEPPAAVRPDVPVTRNRLLDRPSLAALAIYFAISLIIFGGALLDRGGYIGRGPDASLVMWFLAWWPHALADRINPFFSHAIWAPTGINLAWTTAFPLPSLALSPLTANSGPAATFNLLSLASLPLSAWAAFLLCRYVARSWWAALLGGYIYGFSAFALQKQECGQLVLTLAFLEPLAVLLVVRAIVGEIATGRFIAALAAVLAAQFLIEPESFAMLTLFGAMALLLGWSFVPRGTGSRIARTFVPIAAAYAIMALVLSPYLYSMFAYEIPRGSVWTPESFSTDALNFIVPSDAAAVGALPQFSRLAAKFASGQCEANAYFGVPLILIVAAFAWRHWRRDPVGKLLVDMLVIVCVLAIGPVVHFGGAALMEGPGKILTQLPLLSKVLPARLMQHAFLIVAIIVALWFSESRLSRSTKAALAAIVAISTMPNLSAAYWTSANDTPAFFSTDLYRKYIAPGENLLILPYGIRGNSMLWQAESAMYFNMVGGYSGPQLPEYKDWLIVNAFMSPSYVPDAGVQLTAFMANHDVNAIAVVDNDISAKAWHALAASCCTATADIGGVTLYHASPEKLGQYANVTPLQMEQQADSALFDTLLRATDQWLAAGDSLDGLTPLQAQNKGLLPASWITGPTETGWAIVEDPVNDTTGRYRYNAWLGPMADGRPSVGIFGSYAGLKPIIARYRQNAAHIYFPYPHDLDAAPPANLRGLMVMEFDRAQLDSAVQKTSPDRR